MNSKNPSAEKIANTSTSLNFSLPVQESLRKLANSQEDSGKHYERNTLPDARLLRDFLDEKLGNLPLELRKTRKFDCFFWNATYPAAYHFQPSDKMNTAFANVPIFVSRHLEAIISDFEHFDTSDDNGSSDSDSEADNDVIEL